MLRLITVASILALTPTTPLIESHFILFLNIFNIYYFIWGSSACAPGICVEVRRLQLVGISSRLPPCLSWIQLRLPGLMLGTLAANAFNLLSHLDGPKVTF